MRLPKRGEKGFTLIELLIVVAILGVLAAVVIPNVSRFIGSGETEAAATEFSNIQASVTSMMVDNELSVLPNPVLTGSETDDMTLFPDTTVAGSADKLTDPEGGTYTALDKDGYILFEHDIIGDADPATDLVNYVQTQTTNGTYSVTAAGTVKQETTGYE